MPTFYYHSTSFSSGSIYICLLLLVLGATSPTVAKHDLDEIPKAWLQRFAEAQLLYTSQPFQTSPIISNGFIGAPAACMNQGDSQGLLQLAGLYGGQSKSRRTQRCGLPDPFAGYVVAEDGARLARIGAAMDLQYGRFEQRWKLPKSCGEGYVETIRYMHRALREASVLEVRWDVGMLDVYSNRKLVRRRSEGCLLRWKSCQREPLHLITLEAEEGKRVFEVQGAETETIKWRNKKTAPPRVAIHFQEIPPVFAVNDSRAIVFVAAVHSTIEPGINNTNLDKRTWDSLNDLDKRKASLHLLHERAWNELWLESGGGIEVTGNMTVALQINASLSALLSSVRDDWPWSVSEGGIGSNSYDGHVFWSDSVMDGPFLGALFPSIAERNLFVYREQRLNQAMKMAASNGFDGAYWPWQSAATGAEQSCGSRTMVKECYWMHEVHIGADIVLFLRMTWYRTGDSDWLEHRAWPLIRETARFFQSRVEPLAPSSSNLTLKTVIGPDEHSYIKDSNTYTNYVTSQVFEFAAFVGLRVGHDPTELREWRDSAAKMYVPLSYFCLTWANASTDGCKKDEIVMIHPQYAGYHGQEINQADVVLMQWPWYAELDRAIAANDLNYYVQRTGVTNKTKGFFTGDSSMSIAFLRLGIIPQGVEQFGKAFNHMLLPWYTWTELDPTVMNNPGHLNFLTGAGGFLENLVFGFVGVEYQARGLRIAPILPAFNVTQVVLRNLAYHGRRLIVCYNITQIRLELIRGNPLRVKVESTSNSPELLKAGRALTTPKRPLLIRAVQEEAPTEAA